ncbi:MAG TPA: alpha/beta hydrolase [Acidimicrobiia bacterium]|nr:alpha/beta hydrolase [Acidimicrobiia bacterium]
MTGEPRIITSGDGTRLEAELAAATGVRAPRAGMVLCHPHPQYGGTMRSIVVCALFASLPAAGVTCLRFNFRGVEGSAGSWDEGRSEQGDAHAAVAALASELPAGVPLILAGWSFGADMALSVLDPAVAAWLAIAPPLHYLTSYDALAGDPRPKLLALAEHDEVRAPAEVESLARDWRATEIVVVPGASHFFVGRTDRLVEVAIDYADRLSPGS